MTWPDSFTKQMQQQLGDTSEAFFQALEASAPVSIHLNPQKPLSFRHSLFPIPWNKNGFYLPSRPVFTLDPLFHAGAYYVQEASSMFLAEAVGQCVDLNKNLRVLDLAAAPGGKSMVLASILSSDSLLLSNEVIQSRYQTLRYNVSKWGYPNVWTSNNDAKGLQKLGPFFDLIVVDAPCSGEGLFRREPEAATEWSAEQVQYCSARQKKILADTLQLLRPVGCLIYSTCTFNQLENDENAKWLCKEFGLEPVQLDIPADWNIHPTDMGYQFYPHLVRGEGFYLAAFTRTSKDEASADSKNRRHKGPLQKVSKKIANTFQHWIAEDKNTVSFLHPKTGEFHMLPSSLEADAQLLASAVKKIYLGTALGTIKGQQLVPSPSWALSTWKASNIPAVDLGELQALKFLKKDQLEAANVPRGWQLATYKGQGLGWLKGLGKRVNNYHPNAWRIRMDLPAEVHSFWHQLNTD